MSYMHCKNIAHRDLKPENILMDETDLNNFNIKICDFGFACKYDPSKGMIQPLGSPLYMSP